MLEDAGWSHGVISAPPSIITARRIAPLPCSGSSAQTGRRRGPAPHDGRGRPQVSSDGLSRRSWSPAIALQAGGRALLRPLRPAMRWLHRGTGIAAHARERAQAPAAAARPATAADSNAPPRQAGARAWIALPRPELP